MNQLALGDVLADEAIQRTASHNEDFVDAALDVIRATLKWQNTLTSDDVWKYVVMAQQPTDNRAIGAAFRKASNEGLIRAVGWQKSTRAACHGRPVRVWEGVLE